MNVSEQLSYLHENKKTTKQKQNSWTILHKKQNLWTILDKKPGRESWCKPKWYNTWQKCTYSSWK